VPGSAKDALELEVLGVYRILRACGEIYIGQTGSSEARCKEQRK
jgi:hypothetical protein